MIPLLEDLIIMRMRGKIMLQALSEFFGPANPNDPFIFLGSAHIIASAMLPISILILYLFRGLIKQSPNEKYIRIGLAIFMFFMQISFNLQSLYIGRFRWDNDLPLSLCGACLIICGIMLLKNSNGVFQVIYYWALGGTLQALLTPSIAAYGPSNYRFWQYFMAHEGIIFVVFYMFFVSGYRPEKGSAFRSIKWLTVFAIIDLIVNKLLDANYLFLMGPLDTPTPLDYMPAFPMNIPVLLIIAILLFQILYLPFALKNRRSHKRTPIEILD